MKHLPSTPSRCILGLGALLGALPGLVFGQALNLTQSPLYLGTLVQPNVLVVYDNSQSMDGTMAGKLIAGDDDTTRGNIARSVIRSTITSFRSSFQWGLASFGLANGPSLNTTYAYYFGGDSQVVYTNDCVNGISASNSGLRCVGNPQTGNGYNYLTYNLTGDDPSINDVLYSGDFGSQLYGIGVNNSTNYQVYNNRQSGSATSWSSGGFGGGLGTWGFTPTDAGYLPQTPPNSRMFWIKRAWGYYSDITGAGKINQAVAADSTTQYNALMGLLAKESNGNSGELKNSAVFTPLAGTLATVKSYFSNTLSGTPTPLTQSCQKNFVLLATDGNPTGKTDGSMYPMPQQNTYNAATSTWTFSTAANDVFTNVTALRSVTYSGHNYDIQTYVVGLGDTVANASSVAALNQYAALGGTSQAYLADNATALATAFNQISVDIIAKTSAASAVSVNSGAWNNGTDLFQGRFNSGDWSGQLLSNAILASGAPAPTSNWDAGQLLNSQNWSTGRNILTYKPSAAVGSRGVAFRWPADAAAPAATEIDSGMVSALNTSLAGSTDTFGAQRLGYLRGNVALEQRNCSGCAAPVFRSRPSTVLGDIVDSAPIYVGDGTASYRDNIAASAYSSYAATRRGQTPVIYVGANDGMLHGFNANTGAELFGYVPWAVRGRLSALTDPAYTHRYTTDGSPAVGDVYYGGAWHSLLVSGMSAGARGLFALDVSDPSLFTEANAASVVRWEIGDSDADVGYIFSKPAPVPLRDGSWKVLSGNGYNSTNGHAVLLLVDVQTGAISRIDTKSGSATAPNGLSGLVTVSSNNNGVVDIVYAGDLYGNLWKFDLSSATASSWKVAYGTTASPLPLFTTASGQAITARPDATITASGNYLLTFGTGRYIDTSDNAAGAQQALYGIVDTGSPVAMSSLQTQSIGSSGTGSNGNTYRLTTHAVGPAGDNLLLTGDNVITTTNYYANKNGWVLNLSSGGERVVADATIRYGRVSFSSMIPSSSACSAGGSGWLTEVDVLTGNRSPAFDTNGDGKIDSSDYISGGMASSMMISSIPAAATTIREQNKGYDDKLINTSGGTVINVHELGNQKPSRRSSWEQIQ